MPISVRTPRSLARAAASLRALARAALAQEGARAGEITILLAGDAELRALNVRYRGLDRATDVLSFHYPARDGRIDGDIAISLDRVAEQARRFRVGPGAELARLVVHGALHLAGLDHRRAAERRRMRAREDRALRAARAAIAGLDRALAGARARAGRRDPM
jgi:probable rRNA maturation factor